MDGVPKYVIFDQHKQKEEPRKTEQQLEFRLQSVRSDLRDTEKRLQIIQR